MLSTFRTLRFIARHPLNRRAPLTAIGRFAAWQVATRLRPGAVVVPYVGDTRLLVARGMTGATGNVYCGLHEFEDMAFVLHALRDEDLFVDIGANVGSYTVLASGAVGARCVAFEPAPRAYRALLDNLRLNDLMARVEARNECLASAAGEAEFTTDLDVCNHVVAESTGSNATVRVAVTTLDIALAKRAPTILKIDVEGYETRVLEGADQTLRSPALRAVLMELNGSGARYGFDDRHLHERMLRYDFAPAEYDPQRRELRRREWHGSSEGNVLYVRDMDSLRARLAAAPRRPLHGTLV
ncbi:MAG TPA: FkbM family methyltransferase [Steroidobacteraceae bacterium]|nr:FkbM family methyltransferase [Steroidobacteraceae bacterium]